MLSIFHLKLVFINTVLNQLLTPPNITLITLEQQFFTEILIPIFFSEASNGCCTNVILKAIMINGRVKQNIYKNLIPALIFMYRHR